MVKALTNAELGNLGQSYRNLLDAIGIEPPKDAEKILGRFMADCMEKLWETSDAKIGSFQSSLAHLSKTFESARREAIAARDEADSLKSSMDSAMRGEADRRHRTGAGCRH